MGHHWTIPNILARRLVYSRPSSHHPVPSLYGHATA
ncbi:uncharacterized protein G2W53_009868 [Senna tora]|uniref:Uncharacterized protein n=1 Tax=Senna tora TaxID=362788 RepID=A0A834WZ48_9FABA|nr:uncharacterized protein G2W53_009868 [Senna tora]